MKVYKTATETKNQNGAPFYTDLKRSVIIDWDGKIGSSKTGDTKNEIDCIFMQNLVPVFVSCKGGEIDEAELYKLDAVARRFGGKYAKKVLDGIPVGFAGEAEDCAAQVLLLCSDEGRYITGENIFIDGGMKL